MTLLDSFAPRSIVRVLYCSKVTMIYKISSIFFFIIIMSLQINGIMVIYRDL
jgi:hypothetical protein